MKNRPRVYSRVILPGNTTLKCCPWECLSLTVQFLKAGGLFQYLKTKARLYITMFRCVNDSAFWNPSSRVIYIPGAKYLHRHAAASELASGLFSILSSDGESETRGPGCSAIPFPPADLLNPRAVMHKEPTESLIIVPVPEESQEMQQLPLPSLCMCKHIHSEDIWMC